MGVLVADTDQKFKFAENSQPKENKIFLNGGGGAGRRHGPTSLSLLKIHSP